MSEQIEARLATLERQVLELQARLVIESGAPFGPFTTEEHLAVLIPGSFREEQVRRLLEIKK